MKAGNCFWLKSLYVWPPQLHDNNMGDVQVLLDLPAQGNFDECDDFSNAP